MLRAWMLKAPRLASAWRWPLILRSATPLVSIRQGLSSQLAVRGRRRYAVALVGVG